MLKIVKTRKFRTRVRIAFPTLDGKSEVASFMAEFEALKISDIEKLQREDGDAALIKRVLIGATEIVDEDGNALAWSDATRDALLDEPLILRALSEAYLREAMGAKEKN